MGKNILIIVVVLVLAVAGFLFYRSKYMPMSSGTPSNVVVPKNSVIIQSNSFDPSLVNAKVGDKITWTNNDSYNHTITSDTGDFDSGKIGSGQSYSFTFTKAGTFNYHCSVHTFMTAQVVVTN